MRSRWSFPLCLTAVILGYIIVCDLVLTPIHERRSGEMTGWLNGLGRVLSLPGLCIAETAGPRFRHRTGWDDWAIMLISSVPIYLIVGFLLRWAWSPRAAVPKAAVPLNPHEPAQSHPGFVPAHVPAVPAETRDIPEPADSAARFTRRGLFQIARRSAVVTAAGAAGYAFFIEHRNVEITRRVHRVRGLSQQLSGLRIVQLSDLHHGPWTSLSYLRRVVEQTNKLQPDLVFLTGDYVHQSDVYIEPVVNLMTELKTRSGVVATLGNHDFWESERVTLREFSRTDIRLVDNDRIFLTAERTLERAVGADDRKHAMCIAGLGDLWEGKPDCDAALGGISSAMPRLVLSHNPDTAEDPCLLKHRPRIDLMFSGHTHGGQASFPWLGTPITPSKYGQKYAAGLVQSPVGPVYVSRGIGTTILPMRFGVRPEITVVELRPA